MATVEYKLIKNFFTKDQLNILQKYCYNRLDKDKDYIIDPQSFSPAWYNDPLMTSILDTKLSVVEKEANLKLYPTYAYWRYYIFGATLAKHIDRPACEISITACIKKYDNWPIVIEGDLFELSEGDAVLYAGCDQEHWRPGVYKGEGMAQVFLHYVNQQGENKHHAYDAINKKTR
tara:strand:+ start:154 stop:678 length:525 start_codon:yes stop_codon:yes gene_type:complete